MTQEKKPSWLKVRPPTSSKYFELREMLKSLNLATVCQEAHCPNIGECWKGGTATFMLMGETCTRACRFCAVDTGNPAGKIDTDEPEKVGYAISQMKLDYVVLTSVDRDDLPDQGASHFARTVQTIKKNNPAMIVEVLAPDFSGNHQGIELLSFSGPEVYAHNIETVEDLTSKVRDRRCSYQQSLGVLEYVKKINPKQLTKTSIMLGLGESDDQVMKSLKDLRQIDCNVVTLGQYLSPTKRHARHLPVTEYITPEKFQYWEQLAYDLGFTYVASGPLVRSSYKAGEFFISSMIKKRRRARQYYPEQEGSL